MKKYTPFFLSHVLLAIIATGNPLAAANDSIPRRHWVTLDEAHIGNLEIDTKLLDSYDLLPDNIRKFYLSVREVFVGNPAANFSDKRILQLARKYKVPLMGGPLLGKLSSEGVSIWLRPSTEDLIIAKVSKRDGSNERTYSGNSGKPGEETRIEVKGLASDTEYKYTLYAKEQQLATGAFRTAPAFDAKSVFKLVFGSCFHKIGLHNPNLIHQILRREAGAMMLLGDIAVDDRRNKINLHRSDYLLRDVSKPWRQLAANVPLYTSWDDHDYLDNDLGGLPEGFIEKDRASVREVWNQNWNNPAGSNPGIYFSTRAGPVEVIMLDTRSWRENERRGEYGSYLGVEQFTWLKGVLKNSEAPFKVISSGTMWSDDISAGKDSWGTWDTRTREELFDFIENENISGVLLISGDRHGARAFRIPRPSGFVFYEFEAASLGGVPGPDAMAPNTTNQLFGYGGTNVIAFGEFTFNTQEVAPTVTFRLIDDGGKILEESVLPYSVLTPGKK